MSWLDVALWALLGPPGVLALGVTFVALDLARDGTRPGDAPPAAGGRGGYRDSRPDHPDPGEAEMAPPTLAPPDPPRRAVPHCPTAFSGVGAYGALPGTSGGAGD